MKSCLSVASVLLLLVALFGFGVYKFYQHLKTAGDDFPDYAKREAVHARYGALIEAIQAQIDASESMHDLAARLEKLPKPEELIYLTLVKDKGEGIGMPDKLEIVRNIDLRSSSHTIVNGTGPGELNGIPVVVINLPVERHSIDDCYIYLRVGQQEVHPARL